MELNEFLNELSEGMISPFKEIGGYEEHRILRSDKIIKKPTDKDPINYFIVYNKNRAEKLLKAEADFTRKDSKDFLSGQELEDEVNSAVEFLKEMMHGKGDYAIVYSDNIEMYPTLEQLQKNID